MSDKEITNDQSNKGDRIDRKIAIELAIQAHTPSTEVVKTAEKIRKYIATGSGESL